MTALLGSHEDIAVPPHPVTAVERMSLTGSVNGSSNLRSLGAEILRLNSAMGCFAVKNCSNRRRCKVDISEPNTLFFATERETLTYLLTFSISVCVQLASWGRFDQWWRDTCGCCHRAQFLFSKFEISKQGV